MGAPHPAERRPDDAVGSAGSPAAGNGGQTPEQEAVTGMGQGGLSDAKRNEDWSGAGKPGRAPPIPGGSSGGHSDRKPSRGSDETVAAGHSKSEREAK